LIPKVAIHNKQHKKEVVMIQTLKSFTCAGSLFSRLQILALLLAFSAVANGQTVDSSAIQGADILNLAAPSENVLTSGQPTQEQFQLLASSGVKHIVNLRPAEEQDWDEAAYVKSLGMEYHSIPVAGAAGVSMANAQTLDELLNNLGGQPVLVHCASSNRVGALHALTASHHEGASADTAIAAGKEWGLTSLEATVRGMLTEHSH
jgi:uncharacterized protein (TIGR01244 family)